MFYINITFTQYFVNYMTVPVYVCGIIIHLENDWKPYRFISGIMLHYRINIFRYRIRFLSKSLNLYFVQNEYVKFLSSFS